MAFGLSEFSLKYVCSHEGRQGTSPGRNAIDELPHQPYLRGYDCPPPRLVIESPGPDPD